MQSHNEPRISIMALHNGHYNGGRRGAAFFMFGSRVVREKC